jgi:hypothetical protein
MALSPIVNLPAYARAAATPHLASQPCHQAASMPRFCAGRCICPPAPPQRTAEHFARFNLTIRVEVGLDH